MRSLLPWAWAFWGFVALCLAREDFEEELRLRPLPDGKVASTFVFTTSSNWSESAVQWADADGARAMTLVRDI
jgi:hypothetical protein